MDGTIKQFTRRGTAYLIDRILIFLIIRPHLFLVFWPGDIEVSVYIALDILTVLLGSAYFIGCHWRWGRTLGKRIMGLRVATLLGISPPPLRHAFLRFLPYLFLNSLAILLAWVHFNMWMSDFLSVGSETLSLFEMMAIGWLLLDTISVAATKGFRSLHDKLADTVVTNEAWKKEST